MSAALAAACGGTPTSPSGQSEGFTWTVSGQTFTATSNGMAALRVNSVLSVAAANCGSGATLGLSVTMPNWSAGTFPVGANSASINWTPDARTGEAANEAWTAPGIPRAVNNVIVTGGSGSVTISSVTNDWVSGSFTAEVIANPGNRDSAPKTIQGNFELPIRDRRVC
jgi:hypothetical protein